MPPSVTGFSYDQREVSAVPPFESEIFISYAHIDNLPLAEGQRGWVEDFHRSLQIRLQQLLGEELSVWRDKKLQGNDYFDDALIHRFPRIAVLVSILSPRYLQSEWCLRELREFVHAAEQTGGLRLGDRSRIFKIVKTHVPREQHPAELQTLLGYEFYQVDQATGRPREFLLDSRDEALRNYWAKLEDVAYDIHEGSADTVSCPTGRSRSRAGRCARRFASSSPGSTCRSTSWDRRTPSCPKGKRRRSTRSSSRWPARWRRPRHDRGSCGCRRTSRPLTSANGG